MDLGLLTLLIIVVLILLLGFGTPVAFCLGFIGLVGVLLFVDIGALYQLAEIAVFSSTNLFMITLPLFIFMAEMVNIVGIGDDVYTAAQNWFNWLPGGLAISSVATCAGFAAVSGSSPATAAAIGAVAIPEMVKRGYNKRLAVGAVAAGGTLGILIPPSITMIVYGMITEVSIGQLFIAGIIPGIVLAFILSLAIGIAVKVKPELAPRIQGVSWGKRFSSLKRIWPFVIVAFSIIGSIYTNLATPTESAAIGAAVVIIIAFIMRRLKLGPLHQALLRTIAVTSMIMFMVIGGLMFSFLLSNLTIPQYITQWVTNFSGSKWMIMIVINIILIIMGCLLDPMAILVISLPIFFPIVKALGFDPVWFGIIVTINVEIGMITPPVGLNLFILKGAIPGVTMKDIVRGSLPFVLILALGLVVVMAFPWLATWLPARMF
jgi:C4-dicarboxylate transporter DctM subunit